MKLTEKLWDETPAFRRGRRLRLALLAPVAAFAGGLWGHMVGSIPVGAALFTVGAWVWTRLHPALIQWAESRRPGGGRIAAFLWDGLVVGGGGLLLTRGLGVPWSPAVGSALALGGCSALGFAWLLDEGGTRALGSIVSPLGRRGRFPAPLSHVEAHLARRDYEGAREALETFVTEHPRDPRGWVMLGRLHAGPLEDREAGLDVLFEGMGAVGRAPSRQLPLVKQVLAVHRGAGDERKAAPLLARCAERWGEGEEGRWARDALDRVRADLRTGVGNGSETDGAEDPGQKD